MYIKFTSFINKSSSIIAHFFEDNHESINVIHVDFINNKYIMTIDNSFLNNSSIIKCLIDHNLAIITQIEAFNFTKWPFKERDGLFPALYKLELSPKALLNVL